MPPSASLALALSVLVWLVCLVAQYSMDLDGVFQALSDPTRRAVLSRLSTGPASVSELARPFGMALPSFMKHIHMLEGSGWIRTAKTGRVRTCVLDTSPFDAAQSWLSDLRELWNSRTDRLEQFVMATNDRKDERE